MFRELFIARSRT
jgi:hypothetical protein